MDRALPSKRAKQKRNRIITACFDCRERKAGCDRKKPICSRCHDGRFCIYLDPPNSALINGESKKISSLPPEIKEKVTRLYSQCLGDTREDDGASDYEGLEASALVTEAASYDDDVDETEVTDLGFHVGKLHLTDRIGGQYRPGMAHELKMLLQATGHQREWAEEQKTWPVPPEIFESGMASPTASFLQPSVAYLAPNLDLFSAGSNKDLMSYLPPLNVSLRILQQYWQSVHPVARILHRPSFEQRWHIFANNLSSKIRPVKSLQALVFSVLFSGIVAMPPGTLEQEMGEDQHLTMTSLKAGTELALMQAQMLQTAKVETLQAFVAYLVVLCREEVSRVHSSLVAAAIRIAECNGLHVDGEQRGYNPIETHVRRLIWFNLCFLDVRTAEAQGPRPIIISENYTTKFPANINDEDLKIDDKSEPAESKWTEMTVPLIRFRCNEFIRSIWVNRRKLLTKEISITHVLNGIEAFRSEWSLQFSPDRPDEPLQRYGACMLDLQSARTYAMILHPYHIHSKLQMPDRLLSILIENGIKTMDRVIELETWPEYARWRWYAGALQQHHYALLMATEIIMNPRRKESSRIWHGLDYVFEPPPNLPPIAKARWIVSQAWWRMEVYVGKRSLRVPMNLAENLREALKVSTRESDQGEKRSTSGSKMMPLEDASPDLSGEGLQPATGYQGNNSGNKKQPSGAKSSPGNQGRGKRVDQSLSPVGSDASSSHSANSASANRGPIKQVVDVDWAVLNTYYPPEQYTGDLDVPFDTWSTALQATPSHPKSHQPNAARSALDTFPFSYGGDIASFPSPDNMNTQQWPGMWPQPEFAPQHQSNAQLGGYGTGQNTVPNTAWMGSGAALAAHDQHSSNMPTNYNQQAVPHSTAQPVLHQQYGLLPDNTPPTGPAQWQGEDNNTADYRMPLNVSHLDPHITPEQQREISHRVNFNMGLYQPIRRPR